MRRGYDLFESRLIGLVGMVVSEMGVEQVFLLEEHMRDYLSANPEVKKDRALCKEVKQQLEEYFSGKLVGFMGTRTDVQECLLAHEQGIIAKKKEKEKYKTGVD